MNRLNVCTSSYPSINQIRLPVFKPNASHLGYSFLRGPVLKLMHVKSTEKNNFAKISK